MTPFANLHVLVIDNFDSFTYNLVDEFARRGAAVQVFRNTISVERIETALNESQSQKQLILFSPGPGKPSEAGNMPAMIERFCGRFPLLGICLGHQAIVEAFGGKVASAKQIQHGKASCLDDTQHPLFSGLPRPVRIARYHSLAATDIPSSLDIIATSEREVMAVAAKEQRVIGFQFHPESILSTWGGRILENVVRYFYDDQDN